MLDIQKGSDMERNGREIRIGEHRLSLGEDNILRVTLVGDTDGAEAAAIKDADNQLKRDIEGKVGVLVDLNKAGKQSTEARLTFRELTEDVRTGRVAMHGMHPVARVIAAFVTGITRKKDFRFFKTADEAVAWLSE